MTGVRILEARSRTELKAWASFPRRVIYPAGNPWVPPLDSDLRRMLNPRKNPFFRYGEAVPLLAMGAADDIVGRILVQRYDRHIERYGERAVFFGYFECVDDPAVARALIEAAVERGRRWGCSVLRGPFNMTAMQEMGVLREGFEEAPAIDETYTAPYYPTLLEAAGLSAVFPVSTFRVDDVSRVDPDALLSDRHRALLAGGKLRIRPADPKAYDREFETLRQLLNDSFHDNPHFVDITEEEFEFQIGPYRRLMDPAISLVAEMDGVPCGFVVAVPDYNLALRKMHGSMGPRALFAFLRERRKIHEAALIIMGAQRRLQGQGVMRVIQAELMRALQRRGYQKLTITWIADVNEKSLGTARALGARPLHRLCLYEMPIGEPGATA